MQQSCRVHARDLAPSSRRKCLSGVIYGAQGQLTPSSGREETAGWARSVATAVLSVRSGGERYSWRARRDGRSFGTVPAFELAQGQARDWHLEVDAAVRAVVAITGFSPDSITEIPHF